MQYEDLGGGAYFIHFLWDSNDRDELVETEDKSMAIDQLMRFDLEGQTGWGIFEILMGGRRLSRGTRTGGRWTCRRSSRTGKRSTACPQTGEEKS